LESWLLAAPQTPETLLPVLTNNEAEASATKANSNVYSIKSWPDSSRQNLCMKDRISFFSFRLSAPRAVDPWRRDSGCRPGAGIRAIN
jgi:hypothetical protein